MAQSKIAGITDTGWQNIPAGDASGYDKATLQTLMYRKVGGIVYIKMYNNSSITAGWKNIGRLPVGCRSNQMIYASGSGRSSGGYEIQLQENGNLFLNGSATIPFVSLGMSYPVD